MREAKAWEGAVAHRWMNGHDIVSGLLSYHYCYLTSKLYLPLAWISLKL
jgi:hypothetical protein